MPKRSAICISRSAFRYPSGRAIPKLCLRRLSVDEPFSCPMTQMLSPRKRPKPPTIATSSPNLRSPARDFLPERGCTVAALERPQLRHLGLELRHRLFEVEIAAHRDALRQAAPA